MVRAVVGRPWAGRLFSLRGLHDEFARSIVFNWRDNCGAVSALGSRGIGITSIPQCGWALGSVWHCLPALWD